MYETDTKPSVNIPCYYSGTRPCGNQSGQIQFTTVSTGSSVTSWRGRRNMAKCRAFDRVKTSLSGTRDLYYCSPFGKNEGGQDWVTGIVNHQLVYPSMPSRFEGITSSDEKYRRFCIAELYAKANAALFSGATFVAELKDTLKYVFKILREIMSRTATVLALIQRLKRPEGAWLEWRYAVMPLILDVESVLEALKGQENIEKYQHGFLDERMDRSTHRFTFSGGRTITFKAHTTTIYKGGSALWVLSQDDLHPYGTGVMDVVAAGWEVVTLSFVVDWFIGIGTWLGSLRDTNLEIGERYATLVKERQLRVWIDLSASSSEIIELYTGPTSWSNAVVFKTLHVSRNIGDDVAAPVLPVLDPTSLSINRWIDAISLLIGSMRNLR